VLAAIRCPVCGQKLRWAANCPSPYYLQGWKNKHLDTCIDALMRLIWDHYFKRLEKLCKNKPSGNEDAVLKSHQKAVSGKVCDCTQISDNLWFVTSSSNENITYEVRRFLDEELVCYVSSTCFCVCKLCHICIHSFSCECIDYVIKNNILYVNIYIFVYFKQRNRHHKI